MNEQSTQRSGTENEVKQTPFQSPLPFILKLRNLIFGKQVPDIFTQVTFYINLLVWITFFVWHIISDFAINLREFIWQQKGIPVEAIISSRGMELGFAPGEFLDRLMTFHNISILLWLLIFVGLVLLYRRKVFYIYLMMIPLLLYFGMNIFYLSFTYFMEDTTAYDKIALLIFCTSTIIHYVLLKRSGPDGSISFFGRDAEGGSYVE